MTSPTSTMTGSELLIELVHRLQHYSDATVLWIFLKEQADEREFATTATKMALDQLAGSVNRRGVQHSIARLQEAGYLQVRVQANTSTKVTVNRDAVLSLLRDPLPDHLPGLSRKVFPFLAAWEADAVASASGEGIPIAALATAEPNLSQSNHGVVMHDQPA